MSRGLIEGLLTASTAEPTTSTSRFLPQQAAPELSSESAPASPADSNAQGEVLDGPGAGDAKDYYEQCEHGQTAGTSGQCLSKTKSITRPKYE
jgi:hypothetical protein